MVSNSKDDHPSKATPVMNTGVTTHPQATTATTNFSSPSLQSQWPVWEKIKPANGLYRYTVWWGSLMGSVYDLLLLVLPLGPVYIFIATGQAWVSPTLTGLHCAWCVCMLAWLPQIWNERILIHPRALWGQETTVQCQRKRGMRMTQVQFLSTSDQMTDKADYSQVAEIWKVVKG